MAENKDTTCPGCSGTEFRYEPSANEEGWLCTRCDRRPGEPPGYSPDLDASDTEGKVGDLLLHVSGGLGGADFLSVSNGSEGDTITFNVACHCARTGRYDQYFILKAFLNHLEPGHSDFWKDVGDGVRAGKDVRDRCRCGALATQWNSSNGASCGDCSRGNAQATGKGNG